MNRLSLWLVGMVALGWHVGLVRAADPAPEASAIAPAPHVETGVISVVPECGDACCKQNADRGGLVGGAGLYWMQPYFKNNPAFTISNSTPTGPGGTDRVVTDRTNIRHQMEVAPQLWLGFINDGGLGGRVRWWYFRQGTDQSVSVPAAAPGTLVFLSSAAPLGFPAFTDNDGSPATLAATSKLQLQVWDIEAIQSLQSGCWDLLFVGGLRWAHISQHYNAYVVGDSGGVTGPISANVLSGHSFHGIGPVLALEARRALGDSGLALYSSARGALLFGSAKQTATDIFISGAGTFIDDAADHRDRVLPVGELEVGVEFGRSVGSSRVFGQVALVGQEWWGAGSASRSVQVNTLGVPTPGQGAIVDSDVGFLGLAFRLGVNY